MRIAPSADQPVHAAESGVAVSRDRARVARALGSAVAPRTETLVLARGTHRTRVSEMRSAAVRAADLRPERSDAGPRARHAATERDRGGKVRPGTG
jgi:hypothetical protein